MSGGATPGAEGTSLRATYYFFASATAGPRRRRIGDLGALLVALGLLAISVADRNTAGDLGDHLTDTLTSLPVIVAEVGRAIVIVSSAYALAILVTSCVRRRFTLTRDMMLAIVGAFALAVVLGRLVAGEWPQVGSLADVAGAHDYPVVRIAVLAAALLVASPDLSRPFRRLSHAAVALSGIAAVVMAVGAAADVLGAVAIGWAVAAILHLVFGSPAGAPTPERIRAALQQLGLEIVELTDLGERDRGMVAYRAVDDEGRHLEVRVAGRDARNAQLASRLWRSLWQRDAEVRLAATRLQTVEHEALMTLLAGRAGARVPDLIAVGEARPNDALIVTLDAGESLDERETDIVSNEVAAKMWEQLLRVHEARLAHRALSTSSVIVDARSEVVLAEWRSAVVEADPSVRATDRAAMLTLTALLLGAESAIRVARGSCGDDAVIEALPYLQKATLSRDLRQQVKDAGLDLASLRSTAATELGAEPPAMVQVQRVTIGKVVMALLTAVAIMSLLSWIGDIGLDTLVQSIKDADLGWLLLALLVGQTQFLGGAISVQGSVPGAIPYGLTVIEQSAIAFVKLAVPNSAARVLTNVRYLQFQGVPRITAFGGGGLDAVSSFIVQVSVLGFLLVVDLVDLETSAQLNVSLDPASVDWGTVLLVVAAVVALACGLLMIRKLRDRFRALSREAIDGTRRLGDVLRSWRQVVRLLGGNFLSDFSLAVTLWIVCGAYGVHVSLATLLAIHLTVSLINGFVPVPGGIGVWETLLSAGLVAAGVKEVDALAIAISWRMVTFYLPPIWGAYSMRWLTRHDYL